MFLTEIYSITWIAVVSLLSILILIFVLFISILLSDKKIQEKNNLLMEQEKKFLTSIIHIGEKERKSISMDLHDNVGMLISTLKLKIDTEADKLSERKIDTTALKSFDILIDKIYTNVKNISTSLAPPQLINFGLYEGCIFLADEINQTGIHNVELIKNQWTESDKKYNEQLYFIIKELINNSIKHNKSKISIIEFNEYPESKKIIIKSDRAGISNREIKKIIEETSGNGIKNIFGRLLLINGKINFKNDINNKSEIEITIDK